MTNGQSFILYDDDDHNDDDGNSLDGDNGEVLDLPDLRLLQDSDVVCVDEYDINNCNSFAIAYIRPTYDLRGSGERIPFELNSSSVAMETTIRNKDNFDNFDHHDSSDFWTIYLLGAYQYQPDELEPLGDGDPDWAISLYGQAVPPTGTSKIGAYITMELNRTKEFEILDAPWIGRPPGIPSWTKRPIGNRFTVAHEVGHLFGGTHEDYVGTPPYKPQDAWLMAGSDELHAIFNAVTLNKIRSITNP